MLSLEGKQLGNYDVIRRIRVGGMGAVYEGRQRTAFDRRVAIKVILGDYANDRDMRRRFMREAKTIARLHHPHILPLIEFGDEHGILYLVMPFIDGGTLTSYLRRSLPDLSEVAAIYQQLLDAVEHAHEEGLIHRDIKSSNVLMELRRSGPPYVYLADFGLVRTTRGGDNSQTGKPIPLDQVPGTPHYMAPEQTRGIVTPLTDIYALGVLLYQLLTGELPYNDPDDVRVIQMHLSAPIPSPCDHDASIPRELGEVVRKAMAKRPEARFQSVAALRAAFLAAIEGPVPVPPDEDITAVEPPRRTQTLSRRASVPLQRHPAQDEEAPTPIPMDLPRRPRPEPMPVAVREKQRTTEDFRPRPRITEEPFSRFRAQRGRAPINVWLAVAIMVPLLLISLLLIPRALGLNIIPAGIPILGGSPVATIYVTAQSKELKGNYVLTAAPDIKKPDTAQRTIPDRVLQTTVSDKRTVATTGSKTINGTQAQGSVVLINNGTQPIVVQTITLTSNTGVRVQLTQQVTVPAKQGKEAPPVTVPAVAVDPGVTGNIPAHSLDGVCCNNGLTVRNPAPFAGGTDPQTIHSVTQADLDGVKNQLSSQLQQRAGQQLQKQLTTDEVMATQPGYTVDVQSDSPVDAQVDKVQVRVIVHGTVSAYNRAILNRTASDILSQEAASTLGNQYELQGTISVSGTPGVQPGKNGTVYLNVPVHGTWVYLLTNSETDAWPESIKGSSTAAALAYLNAQPGVHSVEIHLPFGSSSLPTTKDNIKIIINSPT